MRSKGWVEQPATMEARPPSRKPLKLIREGGYGNLQASKDDPNGQQAEDNMQKKRREDEDDDKICRRREKKIEDYKKMHKKEK